MVPWLLSVLTKRWRTVPKSVKESSGDKVLYCSRMIYLFQSKGEIDKTGQFELFLPLLRICFCIPETAKIISIHDFGRLFNFQVVNRRKTLYFVYNTVCKKQEGATDCVFCVFRETFPWDFKIETGRDFWKEIIICASVWCVRGVNIPWYTFSSF